MLRRGEHTAMSQINQRLRQRIDEFLVNQTGDFHAVEGAVCGDDAVQGAGLAFLDEFGAVRGCWAD